MGNSTSSQSWLEVYEEIFRRYYSRADLLLPNDFYVREIALQTLYGENYIRHLSFSTISEFRRAITERIPRHLFYSSAKYREPANTSMDEKQWMGSDLVFDIDANDVEECTLERGVTTFRFCKICGYTASENIKQCPKCGSSLLKFEHVDNRCIRKALLYLDKLIDVVLSDLNFNVLKASFSGHRGFHLIVELDQPFDKMNQETRRAIVSYIKLDESAATYIKTHLLKLDKGRAVPLPPKISDGGIRRRIAKELQSMPIDEVVRKYVAGQLSKLSFSDALRMYKVLETHIDDVIKRVSIPIDPKVTIDTTHLVRVPNSINGKTGWIAYNIKKLDISEFSMDHSLLSPEEGVKLKIRIDIDLPRLEIIDTTFSFTRGEEAVLDYVYASYLVFKGVATLTDVKS